MKRSVIETPIIIIFLAFNVLSARWIAFDNSASSNPAEIRLLSSSSGSTHFSISVFGMESEMVKTDMMINTRNETFVRFSIPDAYYTGEIGKPQLPAIKQTIGVPFGARVEIRIVRADYDEISLQDIGITQRIMPALASVIKMPGKRPVLEIDEEVYNTDKFYPSEIVKIENDDIMRGHRLNLLMVVPVQYNPVSGVIRVYKELEIEVRFIDSDLEKTRNVFLKDYSPVFEDFLKRRILNYNIYEDFARGILPLPIHYLIITHNNFQSQVNNLAYWLKKKGFKVKVANQDSISSWNPSGIENYIDRQSPSPTYLLLVGDVNGGYMPAPTGSASGKVTDLYYAETDGSGYLPDIFHGRLSCENAAHITTEVNKILKYEKADLPSGWFKKDAFCAGNDNHSVSEGTHNYCTSTFMNPNGYTTYKLYEVTYSATTQDIFDNVNDGRILITLSGHGNDDGWHDGPKFTVAEVNRLTNGDLLTIATGHCCLANNFGSSTNPCGGESWIRKENGGAVAYYGSCPSTYWDEDDWLQREWYEAVYADSIYEHGRFTEDGMYDGVYNASTNRKQYYYEAYHVLGDPSLDLWTGVPANMTVTHYAYVRPGNGDFTVTVKSGGSPLKDALVCCWIPAQSPEMHVAGYTNASGTAVLNVNPSTPGDTMYVTVTKHNYIPYEGYALVNSPSGPSVSLSSTVLSDSGGNGQVNPGERVELGCWAKNIGSAVARSVYGLLRESDSYVTVSVDSAWYGDIGVGDSVRSGPDYRFRVAGDCPDGHAVRFALEFHDGNDSIWTSHPSFVVYAPVLGFVGVAVVNDNNSNGVLDPGEAADLVVTLRNTGGADARDVVSTLMTSSSYITVNDNSGRYGVISSGDSVSNDSDVYRVTASASTPYGAVVDFRLEVVSGVYCDTLGFRLTVGQLVPTDTGRYYAYYSGGPHLQSPVFSWVAIDSSQSQYAGVSLDLADDQTVQVNLPFSFVYYGRSYTKVSICANGWIAMGEETSTAPSNSGIPDSSGPAAMVAGLWTDLDPGNSGAASDVYYYNDAANHRFIVEWFRCEHYPSGSPEDFEIILYDPAHYPTPTGDGEIIVQYLRGMQKRDNTLGIENRSETIGIQYYYNGVYDTLAVRVVDSFAIKYTTYPPDEVDVAEGSDVSGVFCGVGLGSVYPNPGFGSFVISYGLVVDGDISLRVYDVSGRLVRTLCCGVVKPGYYRVVWDGLDDAGRMVGAGVYFVRFDAGDYQAVKKAVLLR